MPTAFGFRPYTNRNVLKSDYPVCTSVAYNPAGDLKPVAFGVVIDGMRYRYTIKSSKIVKDNNGVITIDCEYIDLGLIKTVRLVFDVLGCRWTIG